ncbi:MAG: glycine cleavage system protein R [Pseudomonadales bacterium]|nr:glycine cleavage system protein R [Pseudomonadales bacterium]
MEQQFALSFVARDRPGLIQGIANQVTVHGGNWLESRMSQLAGMFAGIVLVEVETDQAEALRAAIAKLEGISSVVEDVVHAEPALRTRQVALNIVGPDRAGIVHEVTFELVQHVANIREMDTNIAAAPMTGEITFSADAILEVPDTLDLDKLSDKLDAIADRLGVDILLEEDADD